MTDPWNVNVWADNDPPPPGQGEWPPKGHTRTKGPKLTPGTKKPKTS
jgi:hypothetical protein